MTAGSIFGTVVFIGVIVLIVWGREKLRKRAAQEREKRESTNGRRGEFD